MGGSLPADPEGVNVLHALDWSRTGGGWVTEKYIEP